jgi:dCMP deaminase
MQGHDMNDVIIVYMPVVHRGYLDYLASTGAKKVYALQASDLPQFPQLVREMRALSVDELATTLQGFGYEVRPFAELRMNELPQEVRIFVPEDDVTRSLQFDREVVWGSWFLRWDWSKGTAVGFVQPEADRIIRKGDADYAKYSSRMRELLEFAKRSSDWWRQVAAMAVAIDGRTIVAYNKHFPHEHAPYLDGDPRDSFKPGEFIEISTALHGEQAVIAEAARRGICLEGGELCVTTFPCNLCAPWIPTAGLAKVFFTGGYSNLNGQKTLRDNGVELIYVEL